MENKRQWGKNSVNIQGRIMVLVHHLSSYSYLYIFISIPIKDMAQSGIHYKKVNCYGEITL